MNMGKQKNITDLRIEDKSLAQGFTVLNSFLRTLVPLRRSWGFLISTLASLTWCGGFAFGLEEDK